MACRDRVPSHTTTNTPLLEIYKNETRRKAIHHRRIITDLETSLNTLQNPAAFCSRPLTRRRSGRPLSSSRSYQHNRAKLLGLTLVLHSVPSNSYKARKSMGPVTLAAAASRSQSIGNVLFEMWLFRLFILDKCRWREPSVAGSCLLRLIGRKDSRIHAVPADVDWLGPVFDGWGVWQYSLILPNSCVYRERIISHPLHLQLQKSFLLSIIHCRSIVVAPAIAFQSSRFQVYAAEQLSVTFTKCRSPTSFDAARPGSFWAVE